MEFYEDIAQRLRTRLDELETTLERLEAEQAQPLDADSEEQANQIEDIETSQGLEAVHLQESRQIRAALARIAEGSYGTCAGCGAAIAPARLQAQPTATRCIDCAA